MSHSDKFSVSYVVIIYKITNTINGKSYIGQTTKTFEERYNDSGHWWICTGNAHLKNSAAKHGKDNFTVEILDDQIKTIEELDKKEIHYIKLYNSLHPNGYNFCSGGGHRDYCDAVCDKISKVLRSGKTYKFKSPEGRVIEVENLARFCRERGLSRTAMIVLHSKKKRYIQHKGWTLPETELKEKKFLSPDRVLHVLKERELRPFCRKHGLHHGAMICVWNGDALQHKKWTKYE